MEGGRGGIRGRGACLSKREEHGRVGLECFSLPVGTASVIFAAWAVSCCASPGVRFDRYGTYLSKGTRESRGGGGGGYIS